MEVNVDQKLIFLEIPNNLQQLVELAVLKNSEILEQIERVKAQREKNSPS